MRRSGFTKPTYEAALALRIASNERRRANAAQSRSGNAFVSENENTLKARPLQRRSRLKPGKKTKAWESERAKLKKRFERVGITTCELKGVIEHDCKVDDYLSFAHSTKRNDPQFNISEVILACIPGHRILDEQMNHEEMYDTVKSVIARRETQP